MTKLAAQPGSRFAGLRVPVSGSTELARITQVMAGPCAAPWVVNARVQGIELADWVETHRAELVEHLFRCGRLLFRGFGPPNAASFERVTSAVGGAPLPYLERSSPRTHLAGRVYTSTEYPEQFSIFPHNENSYQRTYPLVIAFHCVTPASHGGETTLADCQRVLAHIAPDVRSRFAERRVRYVRNFRPDIGLCWQTAFQTQDRAVVEAHCRANGVTFEWRGEDHLRTSVVLSPLLDHPVTGDKIWFSHVAFFSTVTLPHEVTRALNESFAPEDLPNATFYGDGTPIEPAILDHIRVAYEQEEHAHSWEPNDVLLVDNARMAHGRRPFRGPRQVRVCMAGAIERDGINDDGE